MRPVALLLPDTCSTCTLCPDACQALIDFQFQLTLRLAGGVTGGCQMPAVTSNG